MVDEGQAALLALPHGPVIFQRARRLAIIARGVKPPRWLHRPADAPVIVEVQARYLEELATRATRWEKYDKRGKCWQEVAPPAWFVETLQGRPTWPFPLLEGIVHSPTIRPDGSVLDLPGYDVDTGLFFDSNGTTFPTIPLHPTLDDTRTAIGHLQEAVMNFPFTEPWHFAAWLSAVLSVVCRYTIMGCVPMHGITTTTRGSGKSLLADTIAIIGTGRLAARWSQVDQEDEERKRLLSLALDGDPLVCIDNVTAPLGSAALALALTAPSIKDHILGKTQTLEAPMSAVFLCTGNNMQYVGDLARRVIPIALDPRMERLEERTGFQHNPLLPWVQQERPRLTVAALTIVKASFEAGCPTQSVTPLGSFEVWSDLIRQALVWAGEADPCEGRKDIEVTSNPEFETLGTLLHAWKACYPHKSVTLKQVLDDIHQYAQHVGPETTRNEWNDLQDAPGSCDQKYDGKSLRSEPIGYALRKWQGRIIDGMRLVKAGTYNRAMQWQIECL
jgi:putative DNA primase/helicase